MMKKIFSIFLFTLISLCAVSAQELTGKQKKAKTEIFKHLQKTTRNVQDTGVSSLRFESLGIKYAIDIQPIGKDPLYLIISATFTMPEDYQHDLLMEAGLQAAQNKPVYVNTYENNVLFDCEMYAKDAAPFISVLPDMIKAIQESANNFETEYNKLYNQRKGQNDNSITRYEEKEEGNSSTSIFDSVSGLFTSNDMEYNFPTYDYASSKSLFISKVILNKQETIVEFISYNNRKFQNCSINKQAYLSANGHKYMLTRAEGINLWPNYTDYPNWESRNNVSLTFRLHFQALPTSVKAFNFSEGVPDGWAFKNVRLDSSGMHNITNGNIITTDSHRWKILSIQVTPYHTVVKKVVTPFFSGTYMYSSHDEYIQDVNTGKKYFLENSSLGFVGNPTITYKTSDYIFYEVYPALPTYVKRINISSGSQNYVRNMIIRY